MKYKILLIILFLGYSLPIIATEAGLYDNHPAIIDLNEKIKEEEQKLQSLEKNTQIYQNKIDEARKESRTLNTEIKILDNQLTKTDLDIKTIETAQNKTKLEIASVEYQIEKQTEEIATQRERLNEYISILQREGGKSVLEILILHPNFSDFFNQLNYIEEIQNNIDVAIDRTKLLQINAELKKIELETYQARLEEQQKNLENSKNKLKEQTTAKEVILFQTKHSEAKYQRLLKEAEAIEYEVDSSINDIKDEIKKKIERLRTGNTNVRSTLLYWPVDPSRGITTYFNDPEYPFRHIFEHGALDIRAPQSTEIKAPADAYVARARDAGYGYSYITLIHDNGLSTVYGHVSKILVKPDQFVKAGDIIGRSGGAPGSRGAGNLTTGSHLHFEVRLNGIPVDPLLYLP